MVTFEEKSKKAIPAEVCMISGCADSQTSADVSNVGKFRLPDPAGRAGGACTSALLKVLYADHHASGMDLSWVDVLRKMRVNLGDMGFDQIPQLTSSRMIDVKEDMQICPSTHTGTRRAVLIGINYEGQQGQLSGCHNDVKNIQEFLRNVHGFEDHNMTVLMDDRQHRSPTRDNIISAYKEVVFQSQPGDIVFCHYSGKKQCK
jgi:hypothetical protein